VAALQLALNEVAGYAQARGVTWKFLMTSMPFQNFGPLEGQDRWEGYAAERAFIMQQAAALGITNLVFVTADFHGTIVNDLTVPNPANPTQQLFTGMFEIITGSVAYSAPAGPTFAQLGLAFFLPRRAILAGTVLGTERTIETLVFLIAL
jgi:phosphodiesterase/alkaline phosphatase D-like protein